MGLRRALGIGLAEGLGPLVFPFASNEAEFALDLIIGMAQLVASRVALKSGTTRWGMMLLFTGICSIILSVTDLTGWQALNTAASATSMMVIAFVVGRWAWDELQNSSRPS